ncbi:hypothetical protein CRYUN_Cryun20dG0120300 [Craigia yunnanensis]
MKYSSCSLLGFSEVLKKKNHHQRQSSALPEEVYRQFSLAKIKAATNNFHRDSIIAEGGTRSVYRGTIDDGTMVAVKRCQSRSLRVREVRNEAQLLCQLRHPHLVSLLGTCLEQNEIFVVFEYMSRGSLAAFLYGKDSVSVAWKHRLQICIGAARGLHYLHTGAKHGVTHRDINSSNILLDDECCKLSDFGFSKMGPLSMSKSSTRMESRLVGTHGYMAPEYAVYGEFPEKSDVFAFGVVLFEVLCGRTFYDTTLPKHQLLDWASEFIREGTIYHVIDPHLKGRIAPDCFKKYLEIACSCVHYNGNERPVIGEVEVTLELALELQEKADSEMEGINPYGECINYYSGGYSSEQDSNSDNNS